MDAELQEFINRVQKELADEGTMMEKFQSEVSMIAKLDSEEFVFYMEIQLAESKTRVEQYQRIQTKLMKKYQKKSRSDEFKKNLLEMEKLMEELLERIDKSFEQLEKMKQRLPKSDEEHF